MAKIKYIKDKHGVIIYPIIPTDAVRYDENTTLTQKLNDLETAIEEKEADIEDIDEIRAGAALGKTAYQKPASGIPATDLVASLQTALSQMVLYGDTVETIN